MGMKLLQKKEIATAVSEQRKIEVSEGQKLARQIESIRRIKADEEASLEKFRGETLRSIQAELGPIQKELEDTKKEVEEARRNREELLKPLDAEWEKIKKAKEEADKEQQHAMRASELAQEAFTEAKAELVKAERTNSRLLTLEEVAQNARNSAILSEREANAMKEEADTIKREADIYKNEALADIVEVQRKLKLREESLIIKEEKNEEDRKEIAVIRLQLADQRATLERALKRNS